MKKVLITGANGLVATHLCAKLKLKGYNVVFLSRERNSDLKDTYYWDYNSNEIDIGAFDSVDYIIHLAGASIANKRWTNKQKKVIVDSRVKTANLLYNIVKRENISIKAFISASAIGYYGDNNSTNKLFNENDNAGEGFLADTCIQWEKATDKFNALNVRTVKLRTAVVLADKNSALQKMKMSFKYKIATVLGKGNQILSWIHINDLCNMYIYAIENEDIKGAYNAVAPQQTTYIDFIKQLLIKQNLSFPIVKIPSLFIKIAFGEKSQILLKGNMISAKKILDTGFNFTFKLNTPKSF